MSWEETESKVAAALVIGLIVAFFGSIIMAVLTGC